MLAQLEASGQTGRRPGSPRGGTSELIREGQPQAVRAGRIQGEGLFRPPSLDGQTEAQGGEAMVQGRSALGENPGLLPDAHSRTQLPLSHSLPAKPQDLHGPS